MIKNFLYVLTFALFLSSPAFAQETSPATETEKDIIVTVDGMVCDFCAQSLKKVFNKEDSVNEIAVDLDNQHVIVDTKDNPDELTDDKIKELIEWAGYDLVSIDRSTE